MDATVTILHTLATRQAEYLTNVGSVSKLSLVVYQLASHSTRPIPLIRAYIGRGARHSNYPGTCFCRIFPSAPSLLYYSALYSNLGDNVHYCILRSLYECDAWLPWRWAWLNIIRRLLRDGDTDTVVRNVILTR